MTTSDLIDGFTAKRLAKIVREAEALAAFYPSKNLESIMLPEGTSLKIAKALEKCGECNG